MDKRFILHILPQEERFSPITGGAISTWVNEFCQVMTGFSSIVFSPYSKISYNTLKTKLVRVESFQTIGNFFGGKIGHHLKYNTYVLLAALYAKRKNIYIIHIHNRPNYVSIIKRLNPDAKVILHMHNDHVLDLNEKQIKDLYKYCNIILSVSKYIQNGILRKGSDVGIDLSAKCHVLINGCNPAKFKKRKPLLDSNKILFVGRILPEKGIKQLIQATLMIKTNYPQVKLVIAGSDGYGPKEDSEFQKELKKIAKKEINSFEFLGYVNHQNVGELFANTALYVVPSIWNEPFGLTVLEGMASGIPMIVGNTGAIPEIVGDTAIKVNCKDVETLAETILYSLTHRNEMNTMAGEAHERFMSHFTWDHVSDNYQKIIKDL